MSNMGKTQQTMIDSKFRQWFQRYYEFGVIKKQLRQARIDLAGKTILDAGCASGYSTWVIENLFQPQHLEAFDIMPEQVERAKQRGLRAIIDAGDIARMRYPVEQFDAVFTFGVFHHVPEWPQALREVHRVLKPGGVLVGGELNKANADIDFTWEKFAQDLRQVGFNDIRSQKIYFGYFISFVCIK
ncbi:MAG: class I SAM-dependent methyltransferase [Anaerolineae bacterium]|nr:class I SAM-dependent methyltransferase [Anaerolineae bacterium]